MTTIVNEYDIGKKQQFTICDVNVGCILNVSNVDLGLAKAEILQVQDNRYYVHFIEHNKRLDCWVSADSLDIQSIKLKIDNPNDNSTEQKYRSRQRKKSQSSSARRKRFQTASNNSEKKARKKSESGCKSKDEDKISEIKNIEMIQLGEHYIKPWYFSPYPKEISNCNVLYICEFCLGFKTCESALQRHRTKCKLYCPPGVEIYRCENFSFFEVDGNFNCEYSHNLCLLAKLFLDHKTLYYETDPFLFYVLTKTDNIGSHIIGYFSKEKQSKQDFNVACLLVLPPYQKMGYGRTLIEFSYALTRKEGKQGTPEKPLSDLGLLSYCSYWSHAVISTILDYNKRCRTRNGDPTKISIGEICNQTGMKKDDVTYILQHLEVMYYDRGDVCIILDDELVQRHERQKSTFRTSIDPTCFLGKWCSTSKTLRQI
ncbi:hypothetical protein GJ496_002003 [Pomphorhynchus laevis]|nr:hypothetical protein GJ496_002003 [Pomphorhynchus laevis]